MTLDAFKDSLERSDKPSGLNKPLEALWHDADGDWEAAHQCVQDGDGPAAWVHAYLHRKEGDLPNAGHWYRRADRPVSELSLEQEWDEIATALLEEAGARP